MGTVRGIITILGALEVTGKGCFQVKHAVLAENTPADQTAELNRGRSHINWHGNVMGREEKEIRSAILARRCAFGHVASLTRGA